MKPREKPKDFELSSIAHAAKLGEHAWLWARACESHLEGNFGFQPPGLPGDLHAGREFAYTIDGSAAHLIDTESGLNEVCFRLLPSPQGNVLSGDPKYKETVWVGWFEKWLVIDKRSIQLRVAKWSVYWGSEIQKSKRTIVRAEWDQTCFDEDDIGTAGQPHWHVDGDLAIGPGGIATETGQIVPIHAVAIKKVHFSMAGWSNKRPGLGHAARARACENWQMSFNDDIEGLLAWSIRTLEYIQSQGHYLVPHDN